VLDEPAEQLLAVPAPMEHRGDHFGCEEIQVTAMLQQLCCFNR
jgi:hypothetical protein